MGLFIELVCLRNAWEGKKREISLQISKQMLLILISRVFLTVLLTIVDGKVQLRKLNHWLVLVDINKF